MANQLFDDSMTRWAEAAKQFRADLHEITYFSRDRRNRYQEIYASHGGDRNIYVYLNMFTHEILRIVISCDYSADSHQNQTESVDILTNDANLKLQIESLDSVREMRESMSVCRKLAYEDTVYATLKYGKLKPF
jgi:hypothetical protein